MRPARERLQPLARSGLVLGLAEEPPVDRDVGVDPDDDGPLPRSGELRTRPRLAPSVLEHDLGRLALSELVDVGDDRFELNPELLEDLPASRRRRGEYYSPNQIPISRSADSSESEPWTRLKVTSRP